MTEDQLYPKAKKPRVRRESYNIERRAQVRMVLVCGQTLTVSAEEAPTITAAGVYHSRGTNLRLKQRANPDGTVTFTAVPRAAALGRAWDVSRELPNVVAIEYDEIAQKVCLEIKRLAAESPFDGRKAKVSKPFYTADANDIHAAMVRHWDLFRVFAHWWDKNGVGKWQWLPEEERPYYYRTLTTADHPGVKLWREIALVDAILRTEGKRIDDPAAKTQAVERARGFLRHLNERWPIVGPFKAHEEWLAQSKTP